MPWKSKACILLPLRQILRVNDSQKRPQSLRGEAALPKDKGHVCVIVTLMIPRVGSLCSPLPGNSLFLGSHFNVVFREAYPGLP